MSRILKFYYFLIDIPVSKFKRDISIVCYLSLSKIRLFLKLNSFKRNDQTELVNFLNLLSV